MKVTKRSLVRLVIVGVSFLGLIGVGVMMTGQEAPLRRMGLVDDWTHHHLVFSNPGTAADALKNGKVEQWYRIANDPRYHLQQLKRSLTERAVAAAPDFAARTAIVNAASENADAVTRRPPPSRNEPIKKDWSTSLGTGVKASASGSFSARASSGATLTIKNGSNTLTLTAGSSNGTCSGSSPWSVGFSGGSSGTTSNYSSGIITVLGSGTRCSTDIGVTASGTSPALTLTANSAGSAGNSITLTWSGTSNFTPAWRSTTLSNGATATVQPNTYPAKFSFSTASASCAHDFVVYPTGVPGATGAASIIAYNNLYTGGCTTGTVPSVYWAYNTGGMVTTSPTISFWDNTGSQVAFVQVSGSTASLVLLKWKANASDSMTAPETLTATAASSYRSCTAPCFTTVGLSANDTISSPFYDYAGDAVYVGDDGGNLHKITGAFTGSPSEASGWPVSLGSAKVSSPVYDGTTYVIVGDMAGALHSVTASTGVIHGTAGGLGDAIADAPLVDGSAGIVFAFVTTSGSYSETGDNAVYEFPTGFTSFGYPGVEPVGIGGAGYYLYAGTFDNVYYQSGPTSGNIYVIGGTGTAGGGELYKIPISGGGMTGTTAVVSVNATENPWPSPVSEFLNGAIDYIFFSVNRGTASGCTNGAGSGCILSYDVTNPSSIKLSGSGLNVTTPGTNGCWATGGLVIDNSSALAGASQVYFVGLAGNAASGPTGTAQTSSACSAGTGNTIKATQASQSNP